jgi:hypothetical protein
MLYKSEWWSVDLPANWSGHPDDSCSTFSAEPPFGVLQISSARKDTGIVSDDDLREFAEDRLGHLGSRIEHASLGLFSGFTVSYRENGQFWRKWWVGSGRLMVYAIYNVNHGHEAAEQFVVFEILSSLAIC